MGRRKKGRPVHGWLLVDKPAGMTSTQVVSRLKRVLDAQKAGHAGTLDPAATGLLAVAFGEATKTVPFATDSRKAYRFEVRWGVATSTDDAEGEVIATAEARPEEADIRAALPRFTGDILQVPPQVSAVKVAGERAYVRARAGETMELAARPLHVKRLDLVERTASDTAILEMVCGKGGYVRSIARDLGETLGCLGHVVWLRRLWAGPFGLERAVTWDVVEAGGPDLANRLLPVEAALAGLPKLTCPPHVADGLRNGNPHPLPCPEDLTEGQACWAEADGQPMAIGRWSGGLFRPERVFVFG
ncbi:tRNA pseudouridine(55) synthase TruB [Amaricoccus macauensis]|uniref:tRNA pseudouridine(55) synthase TruB n=1 Tax=Amaricoccus macauensis TaxID=57001 RepID=UPI003C7D86A8